MNPNDQIDLSELSAADLNRIARSVRKARRGKPYTLPGNKFEVYIKPDWNDHLKECKEYTYRKHMIKSKTDYAFGSWAIEQVISSILTEIRLSKTNPPLKDNLN